MDCNAVTGLIPPILKVDVLCLDSSPSTKGGQCSANRLVSRLSLKTDLKIFLLFLFACFISCKHILNVIKINKSVLLMPEESCTGALIFVCLTRQKDKHFNCCNRSCIRNTLAQIEGIKSVRAADHHYQPDYLILSLCFSKRCYLHINKKITPISKYL